MIMRIVISISNNKNQHLLYRTYSNVSYLSITHSLAYTYIIASEHLEQTVLLHRRPAKSTSFNLARHGYCNPILDPISFFLLLYPARIRGKKRYRRLWYLLDSGPLLSIMSRLTFVPLSQLHHLRRRWDVRDVHGYGYGWYGSGGGNERGMLRCQHSMARNDGILHSTKL